MWRILVVSDSHGNNDNVRKAVKKAGKINYMFHLGDVEGSFYEMQGIAGVPCYIVAGNNDYSPDFLPVNIIKVGGHQIFLTHGHRHGVYAGPDRIRYAAIEKECDIAIYGHTHYPYLDEDGDVIILNPGSVTYPRQSDHKRTFAILEIDDYDEVTITFDNI